MNGEIKKDFLMMKCVKILDISDMQNGFTREEGNLYVKGAQNLIEPINKFLREVENEFYNYTLIVLDTHFSEEYCNTEEGKLFPIHCEYGTPDWELSIDISNLHNKRYLTKNQFNMWSEKDNHNLSFFDPMRKKAYDNLFHFIDNPYEPTKKVTREDFLKSINPEDKSVKLDVTIIGVASDYCNRYAMEGWLNRGASVTIINDLTKGIKKETLQILEESQYKYYYNDRLRSIDCNEYLSE